MTFRNIGRRDPSPAMRAAMSDRDRGLAWVAMQRERWGIEPRLQPIVSAGGAVGRLSAAPNRGRSRAMNTIRSKADDIKDARRMAWCASHRNKPAWARRILLAYVGLTEAEQYAAEMGVEK